MEPKSVLLIGFGPNRCGWLADFADPSDLALRGGLGCRDGLAVIRLSARGRARQTDRWALSRVQARNSSSRSAWIGGA